MFFYSSNLSKGLFIIFIEKDDFTWILIQALERHVTFSRHNLVIVERLFLAKRDTTKYAMDMRVDNLINTSKYSIFSG